MYHQQVFALQTPQLAAETALVLWHVGAVGITLNQQATTTSTIFNHPDQPL